MRVPELALEMIRREEGLRLTPYLCAAGVPTIGYGHVIPSLQHPPISRDEAERLLEQDARRFMVGVLKYCPVLATEPEHRLAAVISWTHNLGTGNLKVSTMRRRLNERNWEEAAREMKRWNKARVRGVLTVLPGLVARRAREARMLLGAG